MKRNVVSNIPTKLPFFETIVVFALLVIINASPLSYLIIGIFGLIIWINAIINKCNERKIKYNE